MPSRIIQKDSSEVYKLLAESQISENKIYSSEESVSLDKWIDYINAIIAKEQEKKDKKTVFFLQSLHLALLNDIRAGLALNFVEQPLEKSHNWIARLKLCSLTTAGIIYGACEGFDGGMAMLAPLSLSAAIVVPVGIIFSVIAIMVFCAFDRGEIAKNLGIARKNTGQLIDCCLAELTAIKAIRRELSQQIDDKIIIRLINSDLYEEDLSKNQANLKIIQHILNRFEAIRKSSQKLSESKKNAGLTIAKYATTGITGIIFFSGGFFTGQTVGMTVAGLLSLSAFPTSIPIIGIAILVGAAAFCIYWFVERPGVENLINRWFGIDNEKIAKLCDDVAMEKEQNKLENLSKKMDTLVSQNPKIPKQPLAPMLLNLSVENTDASLPGLKRPVVNGGIKLGEHRNGFHSPKPQAQPNEPVIHALNA